MLAKRTTTPTVFSGALALLALYGCSLQDYDALGEGKEPGPKTEETEDETSTRETPSSSVNETVSSTASESTMDVDASVTTEGDSGVGETTQVTTSEIVTSDTTTSSEVPTTDEPTSTSEPTSSSSSSDESSGPPPPLVVEGNLIQNSSFEQPVLTGTLPGRWQVIGNAAAIVSSSVSHTGTRSWQCAGRTVNWEGPGIELRTILDPGIVYVARAWVRMEADKPATFHIVRKNVCVFDGAVEEDNDANRTLIYSQLAAGFSIGNEWVYLESSPFTLRDCDLNSFVLYFEGPAAGESFYVDDVAVVPYTP